MTDKHNTKYNTLVSEQPYIHTRWSIFTFPGQNEPRPGQGTPWVNFGTIPAIPGQLASVQYMFLVYFVFFSHSLNVTWIVLDMQAGIMLLLVV